MKAFLRKLIAAALATACLGAAADTLQPFNPDSMQRIVEAKNGKPFVVVIWSLDCEFCRTSLKTLSQEQRQHKNLKVVTISTDQVDDPELAPMMRDRLSQLGMLHDAWAFGEAAPERLRFAIDRQWHGEKPRSYWFDGKGGRRAYSGLITKDMIEQHLEGSRSSRAD